MNRLLPLLCVVGSISCVSVGSFEAPSRRWGVPPPTPPATDADGDGHTGEEDCDDSDPDVHPYAVDVMDDGIDQDCTGADAAGPRGPTFDLGSDATAIWTGEERGSEGGVGTALTAEDLDGDGAPELLLTTGSARYADGIDRGRVAVHPLVPGQWGPGQATTTLQVPDDIGHLGATAWVQEDGTGDGLPDVWMRGWVGAEEHGSMLVGALPPGEHLSGEVAVAVASGDLGMAVGPCGDLDGDGLPEVLLRSGDVLRAYATPLPADLATAAPVAEWRIPGVRSVDARYDLTGDGRPDLVVGGVEIFEAEPSRGGLSLPVARLAGATGPMMAAGWRVADLNGDGPMDLVMMASDASDIPSAGGVRAFFGPFSGEFRGDEADVVLRGDRPFGELGLAVAVGDVDGDGTPDLVASEARYWASQSGFASPRAPGRVLVFRGPVVGELTPGDAAIAWEGEGIGVGYALASGFDGDGDGRDDVLIGSPLYGEDRQGRAYWVRGRELP